LVLLCLLKDFLRDHLVRCWETLCLATVQFPSVWEFLLCRNVFSAGAQQQYLYKCHLVIISIFFIFSGFFFSLSILILSSFCLYKVVGLSMLALAIVKYFG